MTTTVLGVDPGLNGGWAVLNKAGEFVCGGHLPIIEEDRKIDGATFANFIKPSNVTVAFVEQVSSRPRQAGVYEFGENTGIVIGVLQALGVEVRRVPPAVWKATFGLRRSEDETKTDMKDRSRELASQLFPEASRLFERKMDDGPAEAALIALHGLAVIAAINERTHDARGNGHV